MSIANPRSMSLFPHEEKAFFETAIVLNKGFYAGQESRLDIFQFVSISYIFEYLSQFEIHFQDLVSAEELTRAVQED